MRARGNTMRLMTRVIGAAVGAAAFAAAAMSAQAAEFYRLGTLGPGSSPFLVMSTFAQIVSRQLPDVQIQVNSTGAATQHAIETAKGQLDFFMWSASVHDSMMKGVNMYAKIPDAPALSKELRAVFSFPIGLYHITTFADSGIEKLEDIKGKKVFLGPPGGGATVIMEQLVTAVTGYKAGTDYEQVSVGWYAAAQSFQDGRIDVYINPTNAPSPVIQQMALTRKIRLLGLTPAHMEKPEVKKIVGRPGGMVGKIEAGLYGDAQANKEDVLTIGSVVGVATGKHTSEESIYRITKAFWEGRNAANNEMRWLREITVEGALKDLNLPLHPGAARYYKEAGLTVPEALLPKQ
jgi:TRAP transporter TAXI family solute receptor